MKNELLKAMQEKQDFAEVTSRRMEEFDEASKKAEAESEAKLNEVNIDYEAKLSDMGNKLLATEAVANAAAEKQQKELNTRAYMMGELQKNLLISQRDAETKIKLANEKTLAMKNLEFHSDSESLINELAKQSASSQEISEQIY